MDELTTAALLLTTEQRREVLLPALRVLEAGEDTQHDLLVMRMSACLIRGTYPEEFGLAERLTEVASAPPALAREVRNEFLTLASELRLVGEDGCADAVRALLMVVDGARLDLAAGVA